MAFPKIEYCLICDDVRPEAMGKATILGFMGISPPGPGIYINPSSRHTKICFFMNAGLGSGRYMVQFKLLRDGKEFVKDLPDAQPFELSSTNPSLLIIALDVEYPGPGNYSMQMMVDGEPHFTAPYRMFEVAR